MLIITLILNISPLELLVNRLLKFFNLKGVHIKMLSLVLFDTFDTTLYVSRINDLLTINDELRNHNLILTPSDAEEIITARGNTLKNHGRIELDINVTKSLISRIGESAYTNQNNYVMTVNDIYEAFHVIKNSTSDFTPDEDIIDAIMVYYNNVCGGSTELLLGKGMDKILQNFKEKRKLTDIRAEGDEEYWNFDESTAKH
jgi:hypothetical protein